MFNKTPDASRLGSALVGSERLGLGMVLIGMALLGWAAVRYRQLLRQIERRDFRPRPNSILILTALVLIAGLSSVLWLFAG